MADKNRSYRKFYNSMKTDSTRSTYAYNMKRFMDFLVDETCIENNEDYEQVSNFDSEKITNVLEDFVAKLNKKLKPAAISTMLAASELFFDMNRKAWFRKLVRRGIKKEFGEPGGRIPATDEDIQRMLEVTKHVRDKAVIHFLASTGIRPAAITDPILRMKHLVEMPLQCKAIKIYDETKEGYWVFLTPEASKALNRYFGWRKMIRREEFTDETPIFANFSRGAKQQHLSELSLRNIVERAIRKSGMERVKKGSKY